jgi:regulatory protein
MGKITSVTRQQKNKERVSIFVDGEYFGALDEKTFADAGLKSGDELTDERWAELSEQGENRSAFNRGIYYISKVMHSKKQVEDYLVKKGYEQPAVDYALNKMSEYGYIDDESYARMIMSHQINVKHAGSFAAKAELRKKGIPDDITESILAEYDDDSQFENAKIQYEKLARKYSSELDESKRKQKIAQAMARRGFDWETIKRAARSFEENY